MKACAFHRWFKKSWAYEPERQEGMLKSEEMHQERSEMTENESLYEFLGQTDGLPIGHNVSRRRPQERRTTHQL